MASVKDKAMRFQDLHRGPKAFVVANPWDAGSARILAGQARRSSRGADAFFPMAARTGRGSLLPRRLVACGRRLRPRGLERGVVQGEVAHVRLAHARDQPDSQ